MTNEKRCILAGICKEAGKSDVCNNRCASYVAMSGSSGKGGRLASANIPSDYALTTLKSSPTRVSQPEEYKALEAYKKTFMRAFEADSEPIKNVYIYSNTPGNGKTTTACAILSEWIIAQYVGALQHELQPAQQPGYFVEVNTLQQLHKRMYSPGSQAKKDEAGDTFNRMMDRAKSAPFLVCDDIGVRAASPSFMSELYDLVNYRISNGLPTVYTSNKTLEELGQLFIAEDPEMKVINRISHRCVKLHFDGATKRGLR